MDLVKPPFPDDTLLIDEVGAGHAILADHLQDIIVGECKAEIPFLRQAFGPLWRALHVNGQDFGVQFLKGVPLILQPTELLQAGRSPVGSRKHQDQVLLALEGFELKG